MKIDNFNKFDKGYCNILYKLHWHIFLSCSPLPIETEFLYSHN
jgi:hypothetical protein